MILGIQRDQASTFDERVTWTPDGKSASDSICMMMESFDIRSNHGKECKEEITTPMGDSNNNNKNSSSNTRRGFKTRFKINRNSMVHSEIGNSKIVFSNFEILRVIISF